MSYCLSRLRGSYIIGLCVMPRLDMTHYYAEVAAEDSDVVALIKELLDTRIRCVDFNIPIGSARACLSYFFGRVDHIVAFIIWSKLRIYSNQICSRSYHVHFIEYLN